MALYTYYKLGISARDLNENVKKTNLENFREDFSLRKVSLLESFRGLADHED